MKSNIDICVKLRERTPIKVYIYLCTKCTPIGCTCMYSIHEFKVTS